MPPLAASGQRFIDDVLQEPLTAPRLVERAAEPGGQQAMPRGAASQKCMPSKTAVHC
jgi:hypothetical protein